MAKPKHLAILAAVAIAVFIRPLARAAIGLGAASPDPNVGTIPFLSLKELSRRVKGKRALLVGGTRGVGLGTAQALAAAGAHVTVVGRSATSGQRAIEKIAGGVIDVVYVPGDVGTVCGALDLVERLSNRAQGGERFDLAVVSAATFPDWTQPLKNEDGIDKTFAISVVGRYLIYKNMHHFMVPDARILNVMASGQKFPVELFARDVATGRRDVASLVEAMMTFGIGNEIMMAELYRHGNETGFGGDGGFTMVSTHPGFLITDLHRGQALWFDVVEWVMFHLLGVSEEEAGIRQSSILTSEKLHQSGLTFVDLFGNGRVHDDGMMAVTEQNRDWLWSFLTELEGNAVCK